MKQLSYFIIISFVLCSCQQEVEPNQPNIIYILADDLGYGDISALNPEAKISTKHIDQIATNGISFTDAHSNSAVCTPTRYGVLTGRYAWRTWMKKGVTWSWDSLIIKPERTTAGSLLQNHGYHTACVGKWHLGLGWQKDSTASFDVRKPLTNGPNSVGFDYSYVIPASLDIPPYVYIEDHHSTTQQIDTIDKNEGKGFWRKGPIGNDLTHESVLPKLTEKAVAYINDRAATKEAFFLYFPLPAPHTPILPTAEFQGQSKTNEYGDFLLMVDDVVGQIMQALEANQISENTLLIFTSDNGCSPMANFEELDSLGHDPSYIYRGHKADIFEGGHRVPFVAQWPKKIKAGQESNEIITHTDLLATLAELVNYDLKDTEGEDSYNILPALLGKNVEKPIREATVHHSVDGVYAIRQGDWKLIFGPGSGGWSFPRPKKAKEMELPSLQLYNLKNDPAEENNLVEHNPDLVNKLSQLMEKYIADGRSTTGLAQENDTETKLYINE